MRGGEGGSFFVCVEPRKPFATYARKCREKLVARHCSIRRSRRRMMIKINIEYISYSSNLNNRKCQQIKKERVKIMYKNKHN